MATTHRDQPAIINRASLLAAVEESLFGMTSTGFCIHCGAEAVHVEPDAVNDHCEPCGRRGVHGAEELLIMGESERYEGRGGGRKAAVGG